MRYTFVMLTCLLGCLLSLYSAAQDRSKMKFGKISREEFEVNKFEKDTGAHAIILAEIGSSGFDADGDDLRLIYKVHRRIRIMDANGYDAATVLVPLFRSEKEHEELLNVKGISYNLENGAIVETKLDSKSVFTEKQDDEIMLRKFTLPAVKPGTVIEYTYTVASPYYQHLRSWDFQGKYPRLWSEYSVALPEFFDYMLIPQGYEKFDVNTKSVSRTTFAFHSEPFGGTGHTNTVMVTPNVTTFKWAMKDVAPIRAENYITTLDNYVKRVEFQLAAYNWPGEKPKPVRTTWSELMKDVIKSAAFGEPLEKYNGFLQEKVDELVKGAQTDREKAMNIYTWVRDNYTCSKENTMWLRKSIREIYTAKNGSVADINMLLVAMLRKAGISTYPLLLSTRDNGYVFQDYPLYTHFNYVIAGAYLNDGFVTLDASQPLLGFGKLPAACYNGIAREVSELATPVVLAADSLKEQKFTSVMLTKLENGAMAGTFQQRPTYLESYNIRRQVRDESPDGYFKKVTKSYTGTLSLEQEDIEDLKKLESPVMVKYNFKMEVGNGDVLYINPLLGEAYKSNPFKSMERKFPVEMNAVFDELYSFNMEVPEEYTVDELPKPAIANYNANEGLFQYLIQQQGSHIQLRCRIKLAKATFDPSDYTSLRDFFDLIVKKESEQIVLKRKK